MMSLTKQQIVARLKHRSLARMQTRDRSRLLSSLGFEPWPTHNVYTDAYRHPRLRLVVKNALLLGHPPRALTVPVTPLCAPRKMRQWVMQPLVDTHNAKMAYKMLKTILGKRKRKTFIDFHEWNVGWKKNSSGKNQPVLFDW